MRCLRSIISRLIADRSGNIAMMAGLTAPLVLGTLALGVDYGSLTLQKRHLQNTADLAAISAAGATNAELAVLQYFKLNGKALGVKSASGILTTEGTLPADTEIGTAGLGGYAHITKGRYVADTGVAVGQRFVAGATPTNAVKVEIIEKGVVFFASSFTTPPTIAAVGTAASQRVAAFSVGSRLASVNDGLLNSLLGGLLGSSVSLKLMDYQSLISGNVNLLKTVDLLAIDIDMEAGTYRDVLAAPIPLSKMLEVVGKTGGLTPSTLAAVKLLERSAAKGKNPSIRLEKVVNLGTFLNNQVGQSDNLKVTTSIFELISAAAVAANGGRQIALDVGAFIPGLAATKITLAIGEPPVGTPSLGVGAPGTMIRTAQTRLAVDTTVNGLKALFGLQVRIPLYVEVANAEARLADIRCLSNATGVVDVDVVPGLAEISLGSVDTGAFNNFDRTPRVSKAPVVDSLIVKINGMAHIKSGNLTRTRLTFQQSEIERAAVKHAATRNVTNSVVASLLKNLDLDINILFLAIGSPAVVQAALAETLSVATAPLDEVLTNTLMVLGVKIGEADVRVTDLRCLQPALVQ